MSELNNMSDADFLSAPEPVVTTDETVQVEPKVDTIPENVDPVDEPSEELGNTPEELKTDLDEEVDNNGESSKDKTPELTTEEADVKLLAEDPVAFYEKLTGSIKADGKLVQFKSSDEIITAIQQGMNYTRKMQELSKDRKLISTLKKHNIDKDQISYAIDLLNKDPNAIKKLIKDSGLDVMDLGSNEFDDDTQVPYQGSNHIISDVEDNFNVALTSLRENPRGSEIAGVIQTRWDEKSKDFLWNNPQVMGILAEQADNGMYDKIMNEIDRRSTLGLISSNVPFLELYQGIGNEIFGSADQQPTNTPKRKEPIATGTSKANGSYKGAPNAKASTAASPRSNATNSSGNKFKISEMSDEELMNNASKIEAQFNK